MLGPVLGSLVQEKHRPTAELPVKGQEDDGASLIRQKAERAGTVPSGEEKAQEGAKINAYEITEGRVQREHSQVLCSGD